MTGYSPGEAEEAKMLLFTIATRKTAERLLENAQAEGIAREENNADDPVFFIENVLSICNYLLDNRKLHSFIKEQAS